MKPYYEVTNRIREMEARATNILMQLGERNPMPDTPVSKLNTALQSLDRIVGRLMRRNDPESTEAFNALGVIQKHWLTLAAPDAMAGQEHDEQVACNTLADLSRLLSPEIDLSDCGGYDSEEQMSSLAFAIRDLVTDPPSAPGGSRELRDALNAAAYALFQIKRMTPETIPEFAASAHRNACVALDATHPPVPGAPSGTRSKVIAALEAADGWNPDAVSDDPRAHRAMVEEYERIADVVMGHLWPSDAQPVARRENEQD